MKFVFISILILGLATNSFAQAPVSYRKAANENVIPAVVKEIFKESYPNVFVKGWFVTHIFYWQNDISSVWYSDWYGERTLVIYTYEKPTYYEVEFVDQPGEISRAIYNLYGYWYETRTSIKGFPMAIYDALKDNGFGDWKISNHKEKITTAAWPEEVYRFQVTKGMKSRIIRMNAEGRIIQEKYSEE